MIQSFIFKNNITKRYQEDFYQYYMRIVLDSKDIVYGEGAREKVEYIKQVMKRVDYNDFQNSFKEILTNDDKKLKEYYPVLRTMIIGTQHGIGIHKMIELIGADWVRGVIEKF